MSIFLKNLLSSSGNTFFKCLWAFSSRLLGSLILFAFMACSVQVPEPEIVAETEEYDYDEYEEEVQHPDVAFPDDEEETEEDDLKKHVDMAEEEADEDEPPPVVERVPRDPSVDTTWEEVLAEHEPAERPPRAPAREPRRASPQLNAEVFYSTSGRSGSERDLTLENKAIELIQRTPRGSTIRIAIYNFTRNRVADAIIDAHRRGVDIRVIAGQDASAVRYLQSNLPKDRVILCQGGGCLGSKINHNKFMVISPWRRGIEYIVMQSSANFTAVQLTQENDMVVIYDDEELHEAYFSYWKDMARDIQNVHYYREEYGSTGVRAHFFPRNAADQRTGYLDPNCEALDDLAEWLGYRVVTDRTGVTLLQGPPARFKPEEASVRVAMSIWTSHRSAVAHRLVALKQIGVDVRVLSDPDSTFSGYWELFDQGGVPAGKLDTIHSKTMLMEYPASDGGRHYLVYTGSPNFSLSALRRNDEAMLKINDQGVYDIYMRNWNRMLHHRRTERNRHR